MKQVKEAHGFMLEGENQFFTTREEAEMEAVFQARIEMVKKVVGAKWYSDPLGALLRKPDDLMEVANLRYEELDIFK